MRSDIILDDSDTRTMVARDLDHLEKLYCTGLKMVPSLEGCREAGYSVGPVTHYSLNNCIPSDLLTCGNGQMLSAP
jgi:hypothetical protein